MKTHPTVIHLSSMLRYVEGIVELDKDTINNVKEGVKISQFVRNVNMLNVRG